MILGASPDTVEAQARFKAKYQLPFVLLADADHALADAYGVWKEKHLYGKVSMGVERTTFVIGPDGRVVHVFEKVKADGHVADVLARLA